MAIDSKFDRGVIRTFTAEGTIAQYHFVKLNAAYKVEECDAEGEAVLGICIDAGVTDEKRCDIFLGPGLCQIQVGAIVTLNGFLQCDADGEAIDAATTGHYNVGIALQASTQADEKIEMWFNGPSFLTEVGD